MKCTEFWVALALILGAGTALAAEGDDLLVRQCSSCHNLTGPSPASLPQLWQRKGPDLFYAGNKYRAEWMERWLQQPTRIRPAGMFYADHVKSGPAGDEIDSATLTPHLALSAADARVVSANLMQRKARTELITAGAYTPMDISRGSGEMLFDKFKGCLACHEIEPGYGGRSGPEVYTAAQRLQDDYLVSYLRDPQAWDPKVFMPNKHLGDTDIQKFIAYFHLLAKEGTQ